MQASHFGILLRTLLGMVQNWPQGAQKTQKISSNFVPFVPFVAKK